jgi:hypothetical protein
VRIINGRLVGALPVELASTGLYLAVCVDSVRAFKSNPGVKKKFRSTGLFLWKVDVYTLIESLVRHGIVPDNIANEDAVFYAVRNGIIELRKMKLHSLESVVTSIIITRGALKAFCEGFPVEAGRYLLISPGSVLSSGGVVHAGSVPG